MEESLNVGLQVLYQKRNQKEGESCYIIFETLSTQQIVFQNFKINFLNISASDEDHTWIKTWWRQPLALGKIKLEFITLWFTVRQNKPAMHLLNPDSAFAKILINQDMTCCQKQSLPLKRLLHLYSTVTSFLILWEEHLAHATA